MPRLLALLLSLFTTLPTLAAEMDHHHHGPTPGETRQALALNAEEAAHLRLEMRTFLSGVQQIVAGAAANDMPRVARSAQALGMAAAHEVPASLRHKLPLEFKKLGNATHVGFDALARDASSMADPTLAMKQLGQAMQNCVACHATFYIEPASKQH